MSDQHLQRSPAAAPVEVSLARRFEALAAAQPRAPLVVYGEWRLSYRDVNGAANRLAHRLMALGVARNVPVGLCLDRGPDLLVAILAVQKAGGAFVPLDPHWPVDRLGRMWAAASAASRPAVLVTRTALLKHLPEHAGPVLDLDRDQSAVAAESSENPAVRLDPHQWCYVLFTSGSTGVPKGVPVTHGNLAGLFPPLNAALEFGPDDIWTWFHSASFGFSVWELWGALLHGGCLVIVPEHIRQDPVALGELLVDEQVTVFSQTPSAYRRVLHEARFHASVAASRLRYLALSGEALRREDIAGWLARGHRARLLNTYAITETAGQLTLRVYGEGDATEESARNLGQPLEGREVLVLDAGGQPVPRGTAGELWVGGEGVTPGYLSAPDLASRFSELPVPGAGVVRGYLTGDRVRQLPDASLEYLGRVDAQLKFRGYRIEPGDIETALRDHPGVRDAAVALRTDATGNQRLTAWLVAGDASASPEPRAGTAEFWPSLGAYGVYDQWLYGLMNAEPERLAAYRAAFAAAVPGKVVLDIGTGEDAVLARLCIEAGATHVYAVEVLESAAQRATELVRSLGLQDRITVILGDIAAIDLPQRVAVCTQGIIGNIGSADGIAGIWNAARRHFAPGCVAVPERCVTRIAALELPATVRAQPRFGALAADYARRLLATVGQPFDLRLCLRNVAGTDLLTAAADFEVLDFSGELAPEHAASAELAVTRDGLFDGCLLWTVVTAGAGQTVDYFREQRAWLPVYLPLADDPLPVRRGDRLHLRWQCRLDSDPRFPDYSVTARLVGSGTPTELAHTSRHRGSTAGGTRLHRQLLAQLDTAEEPPTVTELRAWLDRRVPEHLIPQSWVFLAALPLGVGGKLDRDALPAPGAARPRLAGLRVAPRSDAEHAVSGLWTEVLGLESLGVEDNFFDLGGDSIAAVQMITRLQRWLNAGVPLAALFEAPSIAGLARYVEQHFAEPLAAALGRAPAASAPAPQPATPTAAGRTPLTFSQQSLWFLQTLYPGDTSASEQFALRLRGPLDPERLEQAWQRLLTRHPILTATFAEEKGTGEKGTCRISPWEMRHVPFSPVPFSPAVLISAEAELSSIAEAALREPFDLTRGPLVRAVLCRRSADFHVLLVTAHHIVADGLSVPVLQADLARLYGSSAGTDVPAGPAYADLAAQPAWQTGTATPAALDWWRQRLANLPPPALKALVQPPRGERLSRRVPFTLEAELADGLRQLARTANATPYMTLLAAFRVLLARLTGQPDVCIGTPMTLRDTPALREVVGCLVNPVVLRVPVNLQQSFRAQLQVERAAVLDTFQYRTVPFSTVVAAVAPLRELGVHPLFQILFSWEAAMPAIHGASGLEFEIVSVPAARASYYDLECSLRDAGEGAALSGYVAWSTGALEDWVAEQLPDRLRTLLTDLLARPDEPLERLALLDRVERQRLLVEWNSTAASLPAEPTLHEWFLAQARRTPDAVALRGERGDWSYGELAARSAALAAALAEALRARGVSGRHVGIAIGRSPELVLAVLAVLRAGGTVVPLDPGFPPTRLEFIARDARLALTLVLVNGEVVGAPVGAPLGAISASISAAIAPAAIAPKCAPTGAAPAFLLYTSGSSGQPKGAFTTHESAVNRCHWLWNTFGFGAGEVFALRTTLNFIDSWWEIFGALGHGVPLQIVPDDVATDPLRLPGFLARTGVTQLVLVPALLRALLEQVVVVDTPLPALRCCIVSGEPLPPALVTESRRLLPGMTLLNTYGTTEIWDATVFDTRELASNAARVPIGRPVGNARVYIVDAAGEPLPPGFPGELQVAGLGVGAGYWQRPELTAEKFRHRAFPEVSAERVYRTGDRARFLADGQVECLGRLDAQFKLRGQRMEPAEIEQALVAHPRVAAALVGIAGEGSVAVLVAGIVKSGAGPLAVEALRAHLQAQLPSWMVPTEWRELAALPLTPSGKLDRLHGLAAGAGTPFPAAGPTRLAPRTALEEQLAALWSEVLGRPEISVHENFFDLGGHSLLAARLLTRIRGTCRVNLELRALFAAPTIAGLAQEIAAQRSAGTSPVLMEGLPPPDVSLPALSFGQERLWFLEQLDPGSPAYNVAWTIRCTGPLELPALRVALDALVARHPALRTRFLNVAGRPRPVTDPASHFPLAVPSIHRTDELATTLATLSRLPFDLERGPLLRVTLLKTGPEDHHLLLVAPHIVTDATSNHVLFADLAVAWAAALDGVPPDWPECPLTYTAFARRQREQGSAPRLRQALDWWRQRLADAPPALELPTDRPRPAEQRFAGAWVQRTVPTPLVAELSAFARHWECTPYMVLLAVFKALLHRSSGAVDLLVGTPVEGRLTADVEQVVGLFINTLVMRTDLSGDPAFSELLARVRNTALDAQAHQEVPFEQLVEVLAPERSLSRSPVFQVMFNLVQVPERTRRVGPLELQVDRLIDQGVSSFDLTLTAAVERDGLTLTFEYATDLFDPETVEQLAATYLMLLQGALRKPQQALSRLPLLDADSRSRVLALGRGSAAVSAGTLVHQRVAGQARLSPEAPAVILDGESLSYGALDAAACRLAHYLITRGAGTGTRVGICLPRTTEYLVAVLAVLKTGAAYVPLDPAYPPERLAGMAADATLSGLIINAATRRAAAGSVRPATWRADLDADRVAIAGGPPTDPARTVGTEDPAYLLFTSGSTGRPKGVVVSHGNLCHALNGWQSAYELRPGEAHLQLASAAFDVYTGDWVRALCTGGSLVVCPRDVVLDPQALLALLRGANIRVAEFVPAVLRLLLEHCAAAGEILPPLRLLIVGSDHWYGSDLKALRRLTGPGTRLINSYGTAEATIDSTWFEAGTAVVDGAVPIGRPFPGVFVYVLDSHGQLTPRGVPGELCVGGGGVAVGYWHAAELTAEKFTPDPHAGSTGARLYRTGDRARWNRSGQLELLGRSDAQFKLRGFRIEPAEIEACLTALPAVAAAAVGLQTPAGGEPRVVGWLVPRGEPVSRDELQQALRHQLPEPLVPAAFVWLPSLPLTPNGKVDRGALLILPVGAATAATGTSFEERLSDVGDVTVAAKAAPTGAVEALICQLYAEVLGVAVIGVDEDFFRAGGHSLLATRLVVRLREALQTPVLLRAVFESPTPRALAAAVGGSRLKALLPSGPTARRRGASGSVPLSPMQQRLWFLERLQPGTGAYHLHWLLRLRGPLDRQALQVAVDALVARHETLRTALVEQAGVPGQSISPPFSVPVGAATAATPADIRALIALPFDLSTAPLLRVTVLVAGPGDHQLLIVMHHLIADGWSFSVLSRELAALYNGARRGAVPSLPALPLHYADYALWQQEAAVSGRRLQQLEFWRSALAGAPPLLALPVQMVRPVVASNRGAWVDRVVPAETVAALDALALSRGCTLFMVLLTGFKAVLGRLTGVDDVLVGTPVAARTHQSLEGLIGFFVNTLVLRTDLKGAPTFRELLGRVRETTLQAFDHADVPFEKLVEVLRPRRSLAHSPLVQVLFALHNQPQQPLELDGLEVRVQTVQSDTVKFDLNLHAAGEGGCLRLALAWRTDLYSAGQINNLLDQYVGLLQEVAAVPDLTLAWSPVKAPVGATVGAASAAIPSLPMRGIAAEAASTAAPTGEIEMALAGIFRELLGVPVGVTDDFFELGGHSLLATRLVAAIAESLGVELPLISVFEAPTVRGLAARVGAGHVASPSALPAIPRLARRPDPGGRP